MTGARPSFSAFAAARDSAFAVASGSNDRIDLVLVAATPYGGPDTPCDDAAEPPSFSLVFRGPLAPQLAQGTLSLRHPQLGELEIFVVPIGRDADGVRYEAVFG